MKRVHTSQLLFLGVWLAVLMAGYMASRASIFAAQVDCVKCQDCEDMDTEYFSASGLNAGTVWTADGHTPVTTAQIGTAMGSLKDNYGPGPCNGNSTASECENYVTEVSYSSTTSTCHIDKFPIPDGTFKATNGQNLQLTDNSFCWTYCTTK